MSRLKLLILQLIFVLNMFISIFFIQMQTQLEAQLSLVIYKLRDIAPK